MPPPASSPTPEDHQGPGIILRQQAPTWWEKCRRIKVTPQQWRLAAILVAALLLLSWIYRQIDVAALHDRAAHINGPVVFILMTVLPLLGFPVSVLHAVAGVRFGLGWGFALVAISILLQLLAAHRIVGLAPNFFARRLNALRRRLPDAAHQPLTIFTMLLPGAPYSAQIYVLPLVGVPLNVYLAWSLPINVARSIVGIAFGEFSDRLSPLTVSLFLLYGVIIMVLSAWSFQRLRKKIAAGRPPAEDDPKPPA
ncbi:hypothetical protein [Verrucomicrobium sp. BvORR034]|uniref:hypothetical protein n=1 Tax=Verrucomicrobium sp. BvORR034 TaxID=1396418 RepID=UPI002240F238|nr:hypothetical protein [Verrucomicrobium sp. BvORR034]